LGYRKIMIKGNQYLINDVTNHLLVMPTTGIREQRASEKAKSLNPIDLAQDSFDKVAPSVTSIVRKGAKRPPATTNLNVVLSKNNRSNEEIVLFRSVAAGRRESRCPCPLCSHPRKCNI
jgi:hypothetical protein